MKFLVKSFKGFLSEVQEKDGEKHLLFSKDENKALEFKNEHCAKQFKKFAPEMLHVVQK